MDHNEQEMGPIQVMIFGLDEPKFDGSILDQIAALEDEGIALLLDAAVVVRDSDDEFTTYDLEAEGFEDRPFLGALVGMLLGFEPADDIPGANGDVDLSATAVMVDLSEDLPVGGAAAVLVLEQTWAVGLMSAIRNRGGYIIADGLIHAEDLLDFGLELDEGE
jgi:uncharacterized membrane protein